MGYQINFKRSALFLLLTLLAIAVVVFALSFESLFLVRKQSSIKVGILHSLTGTMALSEKPVVDAELLAIEEINKQGGVLGMKIVPVIADGRSDARVFAREAERLIVKEKVAVIFGCWTSASRKMVKPVVEKYNSLLFYPVQYEGLEESKNIIYLGPTINQQLIPFLKWSIDNLGKKIFLVGSDYVFPKVANGIAKDVVSYFGSTIVGESYVPLGGNDFSVIAQRIKDSGADVVLNSLNGDSNIAFLNSICEEGILATQVKVMSLSISENELKVFISRYSDKNKGFLADYLQSLYVCGNYFSSLATPQNTVFIKKFQKQYGDDYSISDSMEAAYSGVYLWRQAIEECRDYTYIPAIVSHLRHLTLIGPGGTFSIAVNGNAFRYARIGKANIDGVFNIVWSSDRQIYPDPYPDFRTKSYWDDFLQKIYLGYDNAWGAGQ